MTGPLIPDDQFTEYSTEELVEALSCKHGEVVSIEVQDPDGGTVMTGLVRLHITHGHDFDRSGGYAWTNIIARQER